MLSRERFPSLDGGGKWTSNGEVGQEEGRRKKVQGAHRRSEACVPLIKKTILWNHHSEPKKKVAPFGCILKRESHICRHCRAEASRRQGGGPTQFHCRICCRIDCRIVDLKGRIRFPRVWPTNFESMARQQGPRVVNCLARPTHFLPATRW